MASSSSSDDGDLPRGFPSLTRLTLNEHAPPPRLTLNEHAPPSGLSGDVIPDFRNIALQEHSPSPLPHSEHRSTEFSAEQSSPTMSPVTEASGNVSDPEFGLPPPAYNHNRGNRPLAGRGHSRAHSALHHGHSGRNSYGGIHRRPPSQRSGDRALTTLVRNRLRASEQRSAPTRRPAAASHGVAGQAAISASSPFGPAWQREDARGRWSDTRPSGQQRAPPSDDVR